MYCRGLRSRACVAKRPFSKLKGETLRYNGRKNLPYIDYTKKTDFRHQNGQVIFWPLMSQHRFTVTQKRSGLYRPA